MSQPGGANYSGVQQSAFAQHVPQAVPVVLKPFVYCEYRVESREGMDVETWLCATLACAEIHGMKFCVQHAIVIEQALAGEVTG